MDPISPPSTQVTYTAVLDALPVVAYMANPDGMLSYISHAASRLTGHAIGMALGEGIRELIEPEDLPHALAVWTESIQTGKPYNDRYRLRFADGSYRWVHSQASPIRDPQTGEITTWVGIFLDIQDQFHAAEEASQIVREALVASESAARTLASAIPGVTWTASPGGKLTHISEQFTRTHGAQVQDTLESGWASIVHADDRSRMLEQWSRSLASGELYDTEFRLRMEDETYRWFLVRALPIVNEHDEIVQWVGVNIDIDDRHQAEQERERVQRGVRLLAQTGAVALTSLESVAMTRLIARACVSNFASFCCIDIVDEMGKWDRTSAHADQTLTPLLESLPLPPRDHPIQIVLRQHNSSLIDVDDAWITRVLGDDARAKLYRTLGLRSLIAVPITNPAGKVIGALSCGIDSSYRGNTYIPNDLVFVEEVGRRVGTLIENLRLYERERRIAVELQAASLPTSLPLIDHLQLDAEYRPGSGEATIGGDWYDAFIIKDGRVIITVGDVMGHGLRAAVTMTKLRQAMQAAAMIEPDPNVMLKVADETLKLIDPEEGLATALAAIYDPNALQLTFASAGHPGPILRRPDGSIDDLSSPGVMLGLRSGDENDTCIVDTPFGTSIVLFTDGITEASHNIQEGYDRLHEAIRAGDCFKGDRPAKDLVERVLGLTQAGDDIAVFIATVSNPAQPQVVQTQYGRLSDKYVYPQSLLPIRTSSWQFQSSDVDSAHAVRHSFLAYAASGSLGAAQADVTTAELVLGELIGNVVRHAPGLVTVDIEWRDDTLRIAVSDEGPVFTLGIAPQNDLLREHGRGLAMISQCTTSLRVLPSATGGCRVEAIIPNLPTS